GAEGEDRHGAEPEPGLEGHCDRLVHAGELLDGDAEGEVVAALPVVLARDRKAEQAHLPHLGDDLHRQAAGGVVLVAGGGDDLVGEVAHLGGEALVLDGQHLRAGRRRGAGGGDGGGLRCGAGLGNRAGGRAHRRVSFEGFWLASTASWRARRVRAWRSRGPSTIRPSWAKTPSPALSAVASRARAASTS